MPTRNNVPCFRIPMTHLTPNDVMHPFCVSTCVREEREKENFIVYNNGSLLPVNSGAPELVLQNRSS